MDKKVSEAMRELFQRRFGDDWRSQVSLTLTAVDLYWFANLIEEGIEARRQQFRKEGMGAAEAASLVDWQRSLDALLTRVEAVLKPIKPATKKQ